MSKKAARLSRVRHHFVEPLEQRIAPATFTVVNVNDSGTGSLRDAINLANGTRVVDTINFAIPGTGLHSIVLQSTLPDITSPVIIDGYSQPGSAVNALSVGDNAQLRIELNGSLTTGAVGLTISAGNSTVQGLVINNFDSDGIRMNTVGSNTITGNFIGTDSTGTADLGNGGLGVSDASSSSGNTIGGAEPALRNIISGNDSQGINLSGNSNNVLGNYVGTDATGTADLGNLRGGIVVDGATNTIGGAASGAGNVISGNDGHGVDIAAGTANGTVVGGNFIGTDAGGTAPLKNNGTGVFVSAGANSVIGGAAPNTIAFNGLDGVAVLSLSGAGHTIRGNSIFSNGGLGINLQPSPELAGTVTPNDTGDGDSGPNALQNFPVITAASVIRGVTTVSGTLNSTPSALSALSFAIDIYANTATDATGFGEGQTYLGSTTVTTNPSGNAAFSFSTPTAFSNVFFTATATPTNATPNTSEFSEAQEIPGTVVNTTADVVAADGLTSLREAINYSNATSGAQTISFAIPGNGVDTIALASALPAISDPVVIDGYTQPGASANTLGPDFGTDAKLLIELNGAAAGPGSNGLTLNGSGSIIRGLVINRFAGDGINGSGISGSTIEGNFIGTNAFGTAAFGNGGNGIFLDQSFNNTIGGTTPAARNLIAGNSSAGVRIEGQVSDNNIVAGNLIGTNAAGNAILGTELMGVALGNIASGNVIGGTTAAARNVITGSTGHGITLNGVNGNTIQGNYLGTDVTGTLTLGNSGSGIFISTSGNNVIGGAAPGAGNLIANNGLDGITLATDAFNANAIRGNRIFGNGDLGIDLRNDGVTANDARDGDGGPNSLQNYPVITSASVTGGSTTISGTLNSVGSSTFTIDLFANNAADSSGFGEGEIFIGASSVTTDANGDGSFTLSTPTPYTNLFISATAIADNGDTSEFAQSIKAARVATSFVWDGSAGDSNWFTSANWTPDGVPGASDTAILNINSTINLPSDARVDSFQQSSGAFQGGGKLTIVSSGTFSGGSLGGPGITFIPVGSVFDISGTTDKQIAGRTLTLAGTVTLSGTGNLRTEFDGTIDIQTGGLFDVQSDVSVVAFGGSGFGFVKNAGTFQKSGGTGTTGFSNGGQNVTLDNSGTVRALTGEILIPHGGSSTAGTFDAASAALIDFNGGYDFGDGTKFTGAGQVRLLSGTQNLSGAISSTSLVLEGATITGTHSITGDTRWIAGTIGGAPGTTTIPAGSTLGMSGPADKQLESRTLDLRGTATLNGTGNLFTEFDSVLDIQTGGLFDVQSDVSLVARGGAGFGTVNNTGTFQKSGGTGTTGFSNGGQTVTLNNSGLVRALTGSILVAHGGTSTAGQFDAASGALIDFNAGYTFNGGTQFTGGGEVRLLAGTHTLSGAISSQNLTLAGATIAGTQTISGNLEWRSGSIAGATTLPSGATLNLVGPAEKLLGGGSVTNSGTITWGGTGNWRLGFDAAINNLAGGTFEIQSDASMSIGGGDGNGTVTNAGLLRKLNSTGTTSIGGGQGPSFSNFGTVDVASGTLAFQLSFTQTGGATLLSGGNLGGGILFAYQGGELRGNGTITGGVSNTGATVQPGRSGATGTLSITGDYTQGAGGTLAVEVGGAIAGTQYDQINVGGRAALGGALNVTFINGFTPAADNVFNIVSAGSRTGTFASVIGAGSFTANYTPTQAQLLQTGSVFVWDAGGGADTSWFTPVNWNPDGVPGASDTAILNISSTIDLPRDASVSNFNQSNGILSSLAGVTFTVLNNFAWTGGAQSGPGITTVAAGATLSYSTGGQPTPLDERTLNVNGTSIFSSSSGGEIALSNGAVINNSGIFDFQGPISFTGSGTINNLLGATFKNTTNNHSVVVGNGVAFTNAGLVQSQIGTLGFDGGYVQTAGVTELSGGTIAVSGTLNLNGGQFTGAGAFTGSINNTGGIVRPGGPGVAGTITTSGDYIQGAAGTLETELGGTGSGQFDVFAIGGVASLGGTLTAPQIGGFTPPNGSQFQTITAGSSISGTFNTEPANVGIQYASKSVTLLGPAPLPGLVVTTKLDVVDAEDGFTSLREAILFANQNPGVDTILFNIPGNGVQTILLATLLPTITDSVVIDGFSQLGASTNTNGPGAADNAVRLIELNGASNPSGLGQDGLHISAGGSTIEGLIVNQFHGSGIVLDKRGGNVIAGNLIGGDSNPHDQQANFVHGISIIDSPANIIGGTSPGDRNRIVGNTGSGVSIAGAAAIGNLIQGNFIGVSAPGTSGFGNGNHGVLIIGGGNNTIGGATAAARNLISGHQDGSGIDIKDSTANLVAGNFIGTNVTGTARIPNLIGLSLRDAAVGNVIGGTTFGAGNLISGNQSSGVVIGGKTNSGAPGSATGNRVEGNFIGTDASGTLALGNLQNGISIVFDAANTTIGGANPSARNVIAFNGGAGGSVDSPAQHNAIRGNSIHDNVGLGIDLGGDGPTANDQLDLDSGANGLQNFPVLTSLQSVAGGTRILGTLNSTPNMEFVVQFFVADATGQGRTLLGSIDVNTDGNGDGSIDTTVPTALGNSDSITATATSQNNDTSEFAPAAALTGAAIRIGDVAVTEGQSGTVIAVFTLTLSAPVNSNVSVNFSTADLTATAANNDYVPLTGTATLAPNQLTTTVSITVNGDTSGEARERFVVNLSSPVNARIDEGQGTGVILDDDHHLLVTGSGSGSLVRVFNATTGRLDASFDAFEPEFRGGVRVATGDVNGDGVNDIIAGAGLAGGGRVRVFDGVTHEPLPGVGDFNAFGRFYRGGVYVAAGDVNGDGLADIIVSPSAGGSGQVRVFNGADGAELSRFTVFGKGSGGVRVAAGDVNGDGRADVIAGSGLGSSVRIFDALAGTLLPGEHTEFRAFGKTFRGGVYVAAGDVDGDGLDDVIVSQAADGKTFRVFPSALPESAMLEHDAYSGALRGVRVGTVDVNSDGLADIIAGKGSGDSKVTLFEGGTLARLLNLSGYRTQGHLGVFVG